MKQNHPFGKFIKKEPTGAKKKEIIRQEKKAAKKEREAFFEAKHKEEFEKRKAARELRFEKEQTFKQRQFTAKQQQEQAGKELRKSKPAEKEIIERHANSKIGTQVKNKGFQEAEVKAQHRFPMPLNKFISHSGVCSRRDAADLVKSGKVTVNKNVITEPGHKVEQKDDVRFNGKRLQLEQNFVYILLNKPKDYITTSNDPQGRKTVMDLVKTATAERVYPVGRLDRNTTGVLLLTNDGVLAQKLSHPSFEIKKIYEVKLDKPLIKKDFDAILNGVQLEDGFIAPDVLAYAEKNDPTVIGIEIHSGKNRIVRRIFEHFGYDVKGLDRVMFANLTKKNVERGRWRLLTEKEVRLLNFLNASYNKQVVSLENSPHIKYSKKKTKPGKPRK